MPKQRNILIHGLSLTLRRLPAFLWTYVFNFALALLFSTGLNLQLSTLLNHSLSAQRLSSGFDLGAVGEIFLQLHPDSIQNAGPPAPLTSIPLYLVLYFLLIPGTLFCYQTDAPARLSTLLHQGLLHFWRFVRITLLTLLASAVILGPLFLLQGRWADYVDEHTVGRSAFLQVLAGNLVILLVASVLRLYFDLVEVYTVQLGLPPRNGVFGEPSKPDRRVFHALAPAAKTLLANFTQAWPAFLFLMLLGFTAVILTGRTAIHTLAQPRVWPAFLLVQLGLFLMLFTRFWQRGVETALALQNPIAARDIERPIETLQAPNFLPADGTHTGTPEPIADPEPASPSLDGPDPGVFHHDPVKPPPL